MPPLARYLRLPTSSSSSSAPNAPLPSGSSPLDVDVDDDPLAIELRPLSWKAELSSSLDESLYTRLLLLLSPLLPSHPPTFASLRRLLLLSLALTLLLLASSLLYLRAGSIARITAPPCPNPFRLPGRMHVDLQRAEGNWWEPDGNTAPDFPVHCSPEPPRLLEALRTLESSSVAGRADSQEGAAREEAAQAQARGEASEDEQAALQHLRGRTVLLFGDSIDRLHLAHLCAFLGLQPRVIEPSDALYPAELRDLEARLAAERGAQFQFGTERSRPWLCHAPRADLLLLWVFYPGSDDGQSTPGPPALAGHPAPPSEPADGPWGTRAFWPQNSEHFNPPLAAEERLKRLALPLLANLGRAHVDLLELGLGAWDLDLAKRLDNLSARWVAQQKGGAQEEQLAEALRLTEAAIGEPLAQDFLDWARTRTEMLVRTALHALPPSTPVYLRPLGSTPQYYHWPYLLSSARVGQMEALARQVVEQHRRERGTWVMGRRRARVRIDNVATWTRGVEHWEDHIHPGPLPGSWVWAEWLLYALSRSAQRSEQ